MLDLIEWREIFLVFYTMSDYYLGSLEGKVAVLFPSAKGTVYIIVA